MSRFLRALLRNCGVAIAISVFFAAARGPSHPPRQAEAGVLAGAEARYPESMSATAAGEKLGCGQPAIRVCRLVDAGRQTSIGAQ